MARILVPALLALTSLPAAAQDGGNGLTFGGTVKLEYLDAASNSLAFDGDIGASWRSGGLLGFDASIDTLYIDSDGDTADFTNIWGALVLSTGAGEFAVGAPRPLVDTLAVMPKFSSSRVVDLESSFARGPLITILSANDNGVTPGVTWKQTAGNLTYGAGYHRLNDGSDTNALEGIMRYQSGATTLFISGEYFDTSGDNISLLQIGGLYSADRFQLGASLAQLDLTDAQRSLRLYGSFDVTQSLAIRGDALILQDSRDIYSVSATYNTASGLFVEGGGTKISGGNDIYDVGVGFKF
jgi:hypothetical protein